jgi:prophage regulatory protein
MARKTKFLRLPKVMARTGLSRSAVYQKIAEGHFPKQLRVGGARIAVWIEEEVESWIQDQIHNRHKPAAEQGVPGVRP